MKYVDIEKRSKKEQKAYWARRRNTTGFNTGSRDMATAKKLSRAKAKAELRKALND